MLLSALGKITGDTLNLDGKHFMSNKREKNPIKNGASCHQYKNGNNYRVYKLKDPLTEKTRQFSYPGRL